MQKQPKVKGSTKAPEGSAPTDTREREIAMIKRKIQDTAKRAQAPPDPKK